MWLRKIIQRLWRKLKKATLQILPESTMTMELPGPQDIPRVVPPYMKEAFPDAEVFTKQDKGYFYSPNGNVVEPLLVALGWERTFEVLKARFPEVEFPDPSQSSLTIVRFMPVEGRRENGRPYFTYKGETYAGCTELNGVPGWGGWILYVVWDHTNFELVRRIIGHEGLHAVWNSVYPNKLCQLPDGTWVKEASLIDHGGPCDPLRTGS
jgi:hypothetical protein